MSKVVLTETDHGRYDSKVFHGSKHKGVYNRSMTDTKHKPFTDKQRVAFAKQVELFFEANHPSWRKVMGFSFLKGIATGLGVFVGGTIVVGALLWILSGLGHIPFLNDITDTARETLRGGE